MVAKIINQSLGEAETRCRRCPLESDATAGVASVTSCSAFTSVDGLSLAMFSLLSEVKLDLEDPSPLELDECPLLMGSGTSPSTGIAENLFTGYGLSLTTSS